MAGRGAGAARTCGILRAVARRRAQCRGRARSLKRQIQTGGSALSSARRSRSSTGVSTHEIEVKPPYRLDLTVSALRRAPTNVVDVYTSDGRYLRALRGRTRPIIVMVTQPRRDALSVSVQGSRADAAPVIATIRRMLGTDRSPAPFHRRARGIPWLAPLARRMRGLRPPRYPKLFEACANAILFQQVGLRAASAIMRRVLRVAGTEVEHDGVPLVVFPTAERFLDAEDATLRTAGLSASKLATLRRAGDAVATGALTEAMLEELPSDVAGLLLQGIKGIGPWTASVILLRGLGRIDVLPGNDSGVRANLDRFAGERVTAASLVEQLGSQRGMAYFCLLLARLESRGEIGRASDVAS
ncbi:MAG: DNA-3-methyladenine glycosylase family protein [Gemmatimonadaceae bacterium]